VQADASAYRVPQDGHGGQYDVAVIFAILLQDDPPVPASGAGPGRQCRRAARPANTSENCRLAAGIHGTGHDRKIKILDVCL
jgi:hypothetical protein